VRVADGDPGQECQVDFGKLGLVHDAVAGRRRVTLALIFTAVYSRHMFVWLTFAQTLEALIAGCQAAWPFFGGVFKVLVPDNMSAVVADADALNPRFTVGWLDYAQHCGFVTTAVHATWKARCQETREDFVNARPTTPLVPNSSSSSTAGSPATPTTSTHACSATSATPPTTSTGKTDLARYVFLLGGDDNGELFQPPTP
jgi:hypothetical protein